MLTLYYSDAIINELFGADLNDDTLVVGTYAPWEFYDLQGHVVMDFGGMVLDFNATENHRVILENAGVEIYFDIEWVE